MTQIDINILDEVSIIDFYGEGNKNFQTLISYFPKLDVVARDRIIKVSGKKQDIELLQKKISSIIIFLKKNKRLASKDIEQIVENEEDNFFLDEIIRTDTGKIIKPKTINQAKLVSSILRKDMVFALGPAGTGKTYLSVAMAVKYLKEKRVKKIVLTRPAVEAGENLGFLPGDLKEKLDPYLQPLFDALRDMLPYEKLKEYIEKEIIQIAPLAFMRGRTLSDAFVILDEAQNTTPVQMKMFLTRMGNNSNFIITGDPNQVDLIKNQISGLKDAIGILKNVKEIEFIFLEDIDVVRHDIVRKIIKAYDKIF